MASKVGTKATDFKLTGVHGEQFALSEALTKGPVLLIFFKISCPVCQYSLPFFERAYQAVRGKAATVVAVSQNDAEQSEQFMNEFGISMPVLLDDPSRYPVSNAYGLKTVPTFFLVGSDGEIQVASEGWSKAEVENSFRVLAGQSNGHPAPIFRPGEEVAEWKAG